MKLPEGYKKARLVGRACFLERDIVVGWLWFTVEGAVKRAGWGIVGGCVTTAISAAAIRATAAFDFPRVEIHVVSPVVFVSANIKGDFDFVADGQGIEKVNFIADGFKFHHLGIFAVRDFNNEFTFRESTGEGLSFFQDFERAGKFEGVSHEFMCLKGVSGSVDGFQSSLVPKRGRSLETQLDIRGRKCPLHMIEEYV